MEEFLLSTEIVDWKSPAILLKAKELASGRNTPDNIAKACFKWVRDEIKHINDYNIQTISVTASEVLKSGSGICYTKSHLLAALLRANSIPTGFCYQRLSRDDNGAPYCLHGLNAIHLHDFGWYRVDARGNKDGVDARFAPPTEQLAFLVSLEGEIDFPDILSDPLPVVIGALKKWRTRNKLWDNLPDIQSIDSLK